MRECSFISFTLSACNKSQGCYRKTWRLVKLLVENSINNKIIVQYEEKFKLFSLKTDEDAQRFVDNLGNDFISKGKMDCIFIQDWSFEQRKYLYDFLEENGIPKKVLYRHSTTFPVKHHS